MLSIGVVQAGLPVLDRPAAHSHPRGKLTLSFANVAAFQSFDAKKPTASRYVDEDFNRVWDVATLEGPRQSAELTRARAFRANWPC